MDRRRLPGLAIGVVGLGFGLAAAAKSSPGLALAAAACALAAGTFSIAADHLEARADAAPVAEPPAGTPVEIDGEAITVPIVDGATGLPDHRYFAVALDERMAAARRHLWPTTVLLLELGLEDAGPEMEPEAAVAEFAALLRLTLRQSDVACRLDGTTFGVILEDTTETGGVWSAERLQLVLAKRVPGVRRLAVGVASYPTHGLNADAVMAGARDALARAEEAAAAHGLGQVEVAVADGP